MPAEIGPAGGPTVTPPGPLEAGNGDFAASGPSASGRVRNSASDGGSQNLHTVIGVIFEKGCPVIRWAEPGDGRKGRERRGEGTQREEGGWVVRESVGRVERGNGGRGRATLGTGEEGLGRGRGDGHRETGTGERGMG